MAFGLGTSILVGSLIGAGGQALNAHQQSKAAKKAAGQQSAAADKALALNERLYNENVARMQPFANIGTQALGSLGSLMGFAPMAAQGVQQAAGAMNGTPSAITLPSGRTLTPEQAQAIAGGLTTVTGRLRGGGGPSAHGGGSLGSLGMAVPRNASSFVRVQAPDGEVRELPPDQAEFFIAQGARRV